ncbi:hypothetical protein BHM03_00018202, partial [Ensete ventricosum]
GGGTYGPLARRWEELHTVVRLVSRREKKARSIASTTEAVVESIGGGGRSSTRVRSGSCGRERWLLRVRNYVIEQNQT